MDKRTRANAYGLFCQYCWKKLSRQDGYMVKDEVWELTGLPFHSKYLFIDLHSECLEKIIGRKLKEFDFTISIINVENRKISIEQYKRGMEHEYSR